MSNDDRLFESACAVIPGGVNSPVRAFKIRRRNPGCLLIMPKGRFCTARTASAT